MKTEARIKYEFRKMYGKEPTEHELNQVRDYFTRTGDYELTHQPLAYKKKEPADTEN